MLNSLNRSSKLWIVLFSVWTLHGAIALWQFMSLPADEGLIFGLSPQRMAMIGVFVFWLVFNLVLIFLVYRNSSWWKKLLNFMQKRYVKDILLVLSLLAVFFSQTVLVVLWALSEKSIVYEYAAYAERLSSIANLVTYVSLEIMALILFFRSRVVLQDKTILRKFIIRLCIVLAVLGSVSAIVALTGLGIAQAYRGDWSRGLPAVPLLEWQIVIACLFCLGTIFAEVRLNTFKFPRLDLWISLAIWLGTVLFWLSQPVIPNASALKPHEPNYEIYPFIDAQTYDEYAQSVLAGNGFGGEEIPQRPLYVVFLVFLHTLVGQDYENVIVAQSLFLAVFPVLLYLLGREFFGRPVGISIALLAVLRDYTSNIAAPFTGNLSYSKLYLSEIPTAIFLILILLIGLRWIKSGFPLFSGFVMGGVLGIAMLIRTQAAVALPVMLLFAFIIQPKMISALVRSVILMCLAIALAISPWLWRNWRITGEFLFDNPASQTVNLALRYSRLNGVDVNVYRQAGESNSEYNDRLIQITTEAVTANPLGAVTAVGNYFLNHCVNNILLFPLRNDLTDPEELWRPSRAFWEVWEGTPALSQSLLLVFYVFLFGLGLATAWQKSGWLGFLPLGLNLAYNLWTSIALLSGQRFMVSMDWSVYLYYMIGIFALLSGFLFALESGHSIILNWHASNPFSLKLPTVERSWFQYVFAALLFLGVGLSLPLSEKVFPKKYPFVSQDKMLQSFVSSPAFVHSQISSSCLLQVVGENQLSIAQGKVLYPRYYAAGDGERFTDAFGYKVADEGRMVFHVVGQANGRVIFPVSVMPEFFPNASDITWILEGNTAWFVIVSQGGKEALYISDLFDPSVCE